MKKVTSLLCAMVLAVSAFALPVVKKAPQLTPIQKSVQEGEPDAYYQFTTPTDFVALQYGGGTGDYVLFLYANNQPVAQLSIKTASDNSLAGTYTLGTYGGQSYNSALYQGNNTLTVEYGIVTLKYKGQASTTEDIYEIVASQLLVADGEKVISYSFAGTIVGLAAWKDYYVECNQSGTNCDKARITLTESTQQSAVEITILNPQKDLSSFSEGYWFVMGADNVNNYPALYQAEIYCYAYGSDIYGAYSEADFKFYDDNQQPFCGASLYTSTDDWNTYSEIEIASATGTVTKGSNNTTRYEFFLKDKANKVYHVTMVEGISTTQPIVYYDTNEDFYASFLTEHVIPFTSEGYHKQEGNLFLTEIEALDAISAKYVDLVFYANQKDPAYTIPQGRYSISSIAAANTIKAGYVTESGNNVSYGGAMAARLVSQNSIDMVRYIVSGTADVTHDNGTLNIDFKGSNSLYRTVNFAVSLSLFTGIEEVNMDEVKDGQKMMIDGQLYIKRGENLYNAQGAVVK
ncbi:MAG: hypothetical protein J6Y00_06270 [Paludibacteraceae bacterium]|nr:hypothetical protein [Paludibacteraceae bacterium]